MSVFWDPVLSWKRTVYKEGGCLSNNTLGLPPFCLRFFSGLHSVEQGLINSHCSLCGMTSVTDVADVTSVTNSHCSLCGKAWPGRTLQDNLLHPHSMPVVEIMMKTRTMRITITTMITTITTMITMMPMTWQRGSVGWNIHPWDRLPPPETSPSRNLLLQSPANGRLRITIVLLSIPNWEHTCFFVHPLPPFLAVYDI